MTRPKEVGFWSDPDDGVPGDLPNPIDLVDETWDPDERDVVTRYLRSGGDYMMLKGYSSCRFRCGIPDSEMGSKTLTDGEYVWPEGLPHYLEVHHVKPPREFIDHVLKKQGMHRS